jgi:hypothetical protein
MKIGKWLMNVNGEMLKSTKKTVCMLSALGLGSQKSENPIS